MDDIRQGQAHGEREIRNAKQNSLFLAALLNRYAHSLASSPFNRSSGTR